MSVVEVEVAGEVCRIVLNRPEKLNALNEAVRSGLQDAVDSIAEQPEVRVVVVRGEGRAFSAGADLQDVGTGGGGRRAAGRWQRLLEDFERLPQVTVAQLHGYVIGGAALIAAACDFRVAAEDVSISIPELALGIPLTWAGVPRLAREIGLPRTREMVMTGRRIGAAEALAWGLVHRVASLSGLGAEVDRLLSELLGQPAQPLAITVDGMRALGRALSAPEVAWADPDLLRSSLQQRRNSD